MMPVLTTVVLKALLLRYLPPLSKVRHLSRRTGVNNAKFIAEVNDAGKTLEMQLGLIKRNDHESSGPKKK
jgi:hypothetical protein